MSLIVSYDDVQQIGSDSGGGIIYYYQGQPFTGIIQEFSNDGILIGESEFTDGHMGGTQREYDRTGQIREEYIIRFNKLEGIFTRWDTAGNIISQTHWLNGKSID